MPLAAQQPDISFDPSITQAQFQKFSHLLGQGIYPTPVAPAGASGLLRFEVGAGATLVDVDETADYWQRATGTDFTTSGYLAVPRIIVTKGLSKASISGTYAKIQDSDVKLYGGTLDVPIIDGGFVTPTLALRGGYGRITGVSNYDLKTYGLELFLGKGFGPVTPYGAVGRQRVDSRGTITGSSIVLTDKSDINRYTVGVRVNLFLPKITVEATQAEERSYAAKVSFGF
ncbi:MAG TPA: hypothetical protein VJ276_26220 [Thermoanaerobaculia bacterium]|nr:hypothetical protein [Thermoanaerobaculia bacterium]